MIQRRHILVLSLVIVLFVIWFLWPNHEPTSKLSTIDTFSAKTQMPNRPFPSSTSGSHLAVPQTRSSAHNSQGQADQTRETVTNVAAQWRTPLRFYGKVIDENGKPIAGVRVQYGGNALDETLTHEIRNEGSVVTDERGIFKIEGIRGIGLMVQVSHPDYYSYATNSTGFDVRSTPRKGYYSDTEETAEIFRMHHKGPLVPLIKRGGGLHQPADGSVMSFPLRGKTRSEIIGQLQVQAWKSEPDPQFDGRYSWKVTINVPNGGVLESTNEFEYVAPETGYRQSLEISIPKDSANWQTSTRRTLFFQLPNFYARGEAYIDVYHDLFFSMEYFVNPDGSNNLENDPSKPYTEAR